MGLGSRLKEKMKRSERVFLVLVFLVPVATGLTIGLMRLPEFLSAVASFFVTDPVKQVNIDRGFSAAIQSSQLNIFDDEAVSGYSEG